MGVIEARRRILLNAPHVETTTPAGVANFQTDLISPLRSLKAGFLPVQSGSGDPSPSNVRPISGWSGVTVYHSGTDTSNPTSIPVTFPASAGTVYGGYVDLVMGEVVATWGIIDLGTLTYKYRSNIGGGSFTTGVPTGKPVPKRYWQGVCNKYPYVGIYNALNDKAQGVGYVFDKDIVIKDTNVTIDDATEMKAALDGVMLVYEIATPIAYPLTPQIIKSLRGVNNIWSDANGDMSVEYWKH